MTTTEVPINVQDLHIVVAALGGLTNKAFIGYTAVTGPMSYDEALKVWEDRERLRSDHSRRRNSHILHYAVRSIDDPRFAPLIGRGYADGRTRDGLRGNGDYGRVKAARAWAKLYGYKGAGGGWIYDTKGRTVCQGWQSFAEYLRRNGKIVRGSDDLWYVIDRELVA
jgi:hypothetical protein